MNSVSLIKKLPKVRGSLREKAALAKTTWFNVGGNADILFRPHDIDDLIKFLSDKPIDIPITIIGVASNMIIRDGGIEGVVIKLGRNFTQIQHNLKTKTLTVGAGALNFNVAQYAATNGLTNLEFIVGIPGTIGGGIAMNAGAYGKEFANVLKNIKVVDDSGTIHIIDNQDIGFTYRSNTLPDNYIFVEATFNIDSEEPELIKKRMNEIMSLRASSQPVKEKTGGSTFKNPTGNKAWQLIDEAGLRGFSINDAQISEKHCNFLINNGNASATDLENLGEHIRKIVKEKTNILLEWEIKRVGRKINLEK